MNEDTWQISISALSAFRLPFSNLAFHQPHLVTTTPSTPTPFILQLSPEPVLGQ